MPYGYSHEALATTLRMFRARTKLSQTNVPRLLGVSRETVKNWEGGKNKPTIPNLKRLIKLYAEHNAFTADNGRAEIEDIWHKVDESVAFDEEWFMTIYNTYLKPEEPAATPIVEPVTPIVEPVTPSVSDEISLASNLTVFPVDNHATPSAQNHVNVLSATATSSTSTVGPGVAVADVEDQQRQRMLDYVQSIWIRGVLERSVHGSLQLELRELPGAVFHPLGPGLQNAYHGVHLLLSASALETLFDEADGKLLILGEPGAGKTTFMLKLMRTLIERARQNDAYPMPVVFQLASWGEKRLPITKWLVDMLSAKYQVPRKLGQVWVEQKQILPLFDGLDEVVPEQRESCVEAINVFLQEHGLVPTVVNTRNDDYLQLSRRLMLHNAVVVQPLTDHHITEYLVQKGEEGERLRVALERDPTLFRQITTPLMLNVLTLAYQGQPPERLRARNAQDAQQQIFASYVQRMLQHRNGATRYQYQQTIRWLHWLALQLKLHNLSDIYLEDIQPDWLVRGRLRWLYSAAVMGLVYCIFFAVFKGANYIFMGGADQYLRPFTPVRGVIAGALIGLLNFLICVVLNGIIFGILGERVEQQARSPEPALQRRAQRRQARLLFLSRRPVYGLLCGLLNGLLIGVLIDPPAGIYNGIFIGLIYACLGKLNARIEPAERLRWAGGALLKHWSRIGWGLLAGFSYGLLTGLYWQVRVLPHVLSPSRMLPCLVLGLGIGVIIAIFIAMGSGFTYTRFDRSSEAMRPNRGIWNAARNSSLLALFTWLVGWLFFGLFYGFVLSKTFQLFGVPFTEYRNFFPRLNGVVISVTYGLVVASFFWLWRGGMVCIQHIVLRFILWCLHRIPWNYPRFLDYATECLLLSRVGGGYIFMHGQLLDYFANLTPSHTDNTA